MHRTRLSVIAVCAILLLQFSCVGAVEDTIALQRWSASLTAIYGQYRPYHAGLKEYARAQGFRGPIEEMATVLHEIIHIDSFVHQGFFIDGKYYEPYLRQDAWPALTNEHVAGHLFPQERGAVYDRYVRNTPKNHLGNIVDEINAYGHVLPLVCRFEPTSTEKQVRNLVGFLHVAEGYLRTLRTSLSAEYKRFAAQRAARGAFILILERAWEALRDCGVPDAVIPSGEARGFIAESRMSAFATDPDRH